MDFEALVFDLDGTAFPNKPDGMPNQAVIDAVKAAKKVCHVSVATGRPLSICEQILDALDIEDLCILNGGTHLYSRKTKEYVWKQEMNSLTLTRLYSDLHGFSNYFVADEKRMQRVPLGEYVTNEDIGLSCIFSTTEADKNRILAVTSKYPGIIAHPVGSWVKGTFDIHISNELATKKHALQSLLARLNVHMDHVMVVGDGGNDLPLFELAGWKVAMGNAQQILKDEADWIAPDVKDDGLAIAIRKFILKENLA